MSLFVSTFSENIAAVRALSIEDLEGFILFYIAARVIDPETTGLFEASIPHNTVSSLDILLKFVTQRCRILENMGNYNT